MHPRTAAARRHGRFAGRAGHVRGQAVDPERLHELIARQRRLALGTLALVVIPLLALPVVAAAWDALSTTRIGRLPVIWLAIGPIWFPLFVAIAWRQQRAADRLDAEWTVDAGDSHDGVGEPP